MLRHAWRPAALVVSAAVAIASILPATARLQARATLEIVAGNLVNPRGLNFGPDGNLYVAEAGRGGAGPCYVSGAGQTVCYGATGAITKIILGAAPPHHRLVEGLPSVAPTGGGGATGPHDVDFQGLGNGFVTIGLGTDPKNRTVQGDFPLFASVGSQFGRLVRFKPNGKWSFEEDLALFEELADPDEGVPDSNPYGLLALAGRQVFADAGGNTLNAVAANGAISNLAVFPNGTAPTFQAVPTSVALGPDGNLYVGQLTGFPFPGGRARVYRVPANGGTPEPLPMDFTKIIDIAFGPDGFLYVLQITAAGGPPPQVGAGSLIRVALDGTQRTTVVAPGEGLFAPGGIAIARDGSIYVTNFSVSPGGGTVVKIVPQ